MVSEKEIKATVETYLKTYNRWPLPEPYSLELITSSALVGELDRDLEKLAAKFGVQREKSDFKPYYRVTYTYMASPPLGKRKGYLSLDQVTGKIILAGEQG